MSTWTAVRGVLRMVTASALVVGALGVAAPAALADAECTGHIYGHHIGGSVIVPAGVTCTLTNVTVEADVKSYANSRVTISGGQIGGNVQADRSRSVVVSGAKVGGSIQVKDHGTAQVQGAAVTGSIQLEQGGANSVEDNKVNGDIQLFSNKGFQRAFFNTVDGNLQCKSNSLGVSGWGNVVHGNSEDQCRNLVPFFTDVPAGAAFRAEITWLAQQRITTGYADGTFRPAPSVNRDAMAAFLYRAAGSPAYTPPSSSPFSDVPRTHPFYKEIAWVAAKNISTGYADGTFRPKNKVERRAMAAFLYRLDRVK